MWSKKLKRHIASSNSFMRFLSRWIWDHSFYAIDSPSKPIILTNSTSKPCPTTIANSHPFWMLLTQLPQSSKIGKPVPNHKNIGISSDLFLFSYSGAIVGAFVLHLSAAVTPPSETARSPSPISGSEQQTPALATAPAASTRRFASAGVQASIKIKKRNRRQFSTSSPSSCSCLCSACQPTYSHTTISDNTSFLLGSVK